MSEMIKKLIIKFVLIIFYSRFVVKLEKQIMDRCFKIAMDIAIFSRLNIFTTLSVMKRFFVSEHPIIPDLKSLSD